jgi:DNA-3-methyladenine glycosylase II
MRLDSSKLVGLKLRSEGTVNDPRVYCEIFTTRELTPKERRNLPKLLTWILSLEEDVGQFYALAKHDSLVRALIEDLYGMRITQRPDIFPKIILAVTLQMAPIRRSDQMMNLLIQEYGDQISFDGKEIGYWPPPRNIANASVHDLEDRCKLGYRAKTLKGIAEKLCTGFPTLQDLANMSAEEARAKLMELKGVGEYSADIISPHPGFAVDSWSARIFSLLMHGKAPKSSRDVIPKLKRAAEQRWGRWRGHVFVYVLNDLGNLSKRLNLDLE